MLRKVGLELAGLFLFFAIIWALFTYYPVFNKKPSFEFSIENEEKLGQLLVKQFLTGQEEVHNPSVDSAVWVIHQRLLSALGKTEYEYHIRVVKNAEINAFTFPGGNIVIFSGLIEFSENPEEVAAVLAHEMGHVEHRDVVTKLAKELGITILLSILGGGDNVLLNEISRSAIATVFDRKQEKEADAFAMDLMVKAQVSPRAIASFFRRLTQQQGSYNENIEFLMTHPHNNSRVKASLEYPIPENFTTLPFAHMDWKKVKEALAADSPTYSRQ